MKSEQIILMFGALAVGALLQEVAQGQATALGLSTLEFAIIALAVGAAVRRKLA